MKVLFVLLLVTLISYSRTNSINRYGAGGTGQRGYTWEVHEVRKEDMDRIMGLTKPGDVVIVEVIEQTETNQRPANNPAFFNHQVQQGPPQTFGHNNVFYEQTSWSSGNNGDNYHYGFDENSSGSNGYQNTPFNHHVHSLDHIINSGHTHYNENNNQQPNRGHYNNRWPNHGYQNNQNNFNNYPNTDSNESPNTSSNFDNNQNKDDSNEIPKMPSNPTEITPTYDSSTIKPSEDNIMTKPKDDSVSGPLENVATDAVSESTDNPDDFSIDIRGSFDEESKKS